MLRELPKNVKIAAAVIVVILLALLGYGIYQKATTTNKVAVTVTAAPSDATITLNGAQTQTGVIYLDPNKTYDIKASKTGFANYSGQQYIDATNNTITVSLTPVSSAAQQWAQNNQSQYLTAEGQAGAQADQTGAAFTAKNPITTSLPIDNFIYTIGYQNDPSDPSGNSIILTIDAAEGYRNSGVQAIRNLGFDPTKFKIEFRNYNNPFAS